MLYNTQNPHGGDLYSRPVEVDFSANINPLGTPPGVREAVVRSTMLLRNYPDPYCRELVEAIAAFEGVPRERILCGSGAAELIFTYCQALRPKKAMVLAPCFSEYENALRAMDCAVERYPLGRENGFSLTEAFLPVLEDWDGDLLMLCNPNNPTGRVIPRDFSERILDICREKGIRLFVDECFLDLTDGGEELSMKEHPEVFILKAFTKSYGMAGLRLGYCLSGDRSLLKTMGKLVQPWNVSVPAQLAGIAALSEQEFVERARAIIREQRPVLQEGLAKLGMEVIPSSVNYILFHAPVELKEPLLERGVLIRSCANYPGLGEGWYRVAVKRPEENRRLLRELEEVTHG